jgi:hypothetical protein
MIISMVMMRIIIEAIQDSPEGSDKVSGQLRNESYCVSEEHFLTFVPHTWGKRRGKRKKMNETGKEEKGKTKNKGG